MARAELRDADGLNHEGDRTLLQVEQLAQPSNFEIGCLHSALCGAEQLFLIVVELTEWTLEENVQRQLRFLAVEQERRGALHSTAAT